MFQATLELAEFNRQFNEAVTATSRASAEEALRNTAADLREKAAQQFATEGAAYGNRWTPRKQEQPWPILHRTGRLLLSFTQEGNPEHIEEWDWTDPDRPALTFGSTVPYAALHQRGARYLPARPILAA